MATYGPPDDETMRRMRQMGGGIPPLGQGPGAPGPPGPLPGPGAPMPGGQTGQPIRDTMPMPGAVQMPEPSAMPAIAPIMPDRQVFDGGGPAAPGGLGSFADKLEGFDAGKLGSGHDSPKYQFGRTMSQFDPKGGITQGLLDALNALGLGQVSGKVGGDKISIGGNVDPRFEGVTEFDIIRDLEGGGGWQWGGLNGKATPRAQGARQRGGGGVPMGQGGASALATSLGGGDTLKAIMNEINGLTEGRGSSLTREELLRQLGVASNG